MSNFLNKIPVSPITSVGTPSVPNGLTYGTNFSILQTGGYMEIYSLSGLTYTIPPATTGIIEFTGNTIPVNFSKGSGAAFSPDVLTLNSDNISSGRRKLGMLVYVYETNKIYQLKIDNYETLWNNATGATGIGGPTVVISDYGTTVKNNSAAGIAFISAWTSSTISGINGYDNTNASWRVMPTDTYITGATYFQGNTTFNNSTGGLFSVTGPSNYDPGVISGDTGWSSNNDGSINLPQIRVALYDNPNFFEPLRFYSISSGTTGVGSLPALINNDTNYIIIEYNNGVPRYNVLDNDGTVDFSSILLYMIVYRANNFVHVLEFGDEGAGLPSKLNERIVYTDRFARESGCSLGLSGSTGVVTLSSGVVWNATNRQIVNAVNSLGIFFRNFHSGGTWVYTTTAHTINNLYYDNGTDLVSATAGKYLVNWYFRGQELNDHLYEVVSSGQFDSLIAADASNEPSLPELITSHAFLVGRIIIEVSATTGITQSAFSNVFQPSGAPGVHNDLTGLQGGLPNEYYHLDSNKYNNIALRNADNNFITGQTFNNGLTANTISANTITSNSITTPILKVTPSSPTITISGQSLGTSTDVKLSINAIPGSGGAKAILSLTPFGITSDAQSVVESVGDFDLVFKRNNVEGLRITSGGGVSASTISANTTSSNVVSANTVTANTVTLISTNSGFTPTLYTPFIDDYNRATLSPGGTPSLTYTNTNSGAGNTTISASTYLNILNGAVAGQSYTTVPLSGFGSPFNPTLASNSATTTIEWSFNLRTNRAAIFSGFLAGNYGGAVVLAGTSVSLGSTGNGYALVYGTTGTRNWKLVRYTGGLTGTQTDIVSGGIFASNTSYVSVRIVYAPVTNTWSYYFRDDGTTAWGDPTTVNTLIGSAVDSTYTSSLMSSFGVFFNYSTAANQNLQFDNLRVQIADTPASIPTNEIVVKNYLNTTVFNVKDDGSVTSTGLIYSPNISGTTISGGTYYGNGSALTLGQFGVMITGTSLLTVTNLTTTLTLIPGLTTTITVPTQTMVCIQTNGGINGIGTTTTTGSAIDVALLVDGSVLPAGGYQRMYADNPTGNATVTNWVANWNMSVILTLSAGTHTVTVNAAYVAGSNATVSGGANAIKQGTLSIMILKNT